MKMINSTRAFMQSVIDESPFLSTINYRPWYYLNEYWCDNGDPEFAELFPFMAPGPPWGWALVCLMLVYFVRVWGPKWMADRKPYDLRPIALIVNGFLLGSYAVALLLSATLTSLFTTWFDCSAYNRRSANIVEMIFKHFCFLAPIMRLLEFNVPVIRVLMKKRSISDLHLANLVGMTMSTVVVVKLQPGGWSMPVACTDFAYQIIVYYYLTFQATSSEFHVSSQVKQIIYFARMVSIGVALFIFSVYLPQGKECGDPLFKIGGVVYCTGVMVLFPYDWFTTQQQMRLEKQVEADGSVGDNEKAAFSFSSSCVTQAAYAAFLGDGGGVGGGQTNTPKSYNTTDSIGGRDGDSTTTFTATRSSSSVRNNSINNNCGLEPHNERDQQQYRHCTASSSSIIYKASN